MQKPKQNNFETKDLGKVVFMRTLDSTSWIDMFDIDEQTTSDLYEEILPLLHDNLSESLATLITKYSGTKLIVAIILFALPAGGLRMRDSLMEKIQTAFDTL